MTIVWILGALVLLVLVLLVWSAGSLLMLVRRIGEPRKNASRRRSSDPPPDLD